MINKLHNQRSVPEWSKLCDEHNLTIVQDHTIQTDNVRMINGLHDLVLLHELQGVVLHPLLAATKTALTRRPALSLRIR
jgi:hypothetical protein